MKCAPRAFISKSAESRTKYTQAYEEHRIEKAHKLNFTHQESKSKLENQILIPSKSLNRNK